MNATYQLALLDQALNQTRAEDMSARAGKALQGLKAGAKKALREAKKNPLPYSWHAEHIKLLERLAS